MLFDFRHSRFRARLAARTIEQAFTRERFPLLRTVRMAAEGHLCPANGYVSFFEWLALPECMSRHEWKCSVWPSTATTLSASGIELQDVNGVCLSAI